MKCLKKQFVFIIFLSALAFIFISCNNPFATREPSKPDSVGGDAMKSPNSPENIIYNLMISLKNVSAQDYLDLFSEDFVFNPSLDDSSRFEEDFRTGWGIDKERVFAENFLQKKETDTISFNTHIYKYRSGDDSYEYTYSIDVFPAADSTQVAENGIEKFRVSGYAWLYLSEDDEGKWRIHKWVEFEGMKKGVFLTWAILRSSNL